MFELWDIYIRISKGIGFIRERDFARSTGICQAIVWSKVSSFGLKSREWLKLKE
jgi:hypothetical protein